MAEANRLRCPRCGICYEGDATAFEIQTMACENCGATTKLLEEDPDGVRSGAFPPLPRLLALGDVVKFYGDLQDIGAHKGVIFTTAGYQEGAIKVAKSHGIALVVLDPVKRPTDMKYVTKAFRPAGVSSSDCFLQGRIRAFGGLLEGKSIGEFRFDNVEELLDLLRFSMF